MYARLKKERNTRNEGEQREKYTHTFFCNAIFYVHRKKERGREKEREKEIKRERKQDTDREEKRETNQKSKNKQHIQFVPELSEHILSY